MTHTLHVIGMLSGKTCYLDISLEEAKERYWKAEVGTDEEALGTKEEFWATTHVSSFEFEDEFEAYDVWRKY